MILALNSINKAFGADVILKDVSFHIEEKERVAIVGVNGAGKSTLFKIITGEMSADSGEVIMPKTAEIGYFSQDLQIDSSKTVYEEMLTVFDRVRSMESELRGLEAQMKASDALDKVMQRYSELSHQYEQLDGYSYNSRIRGVISGLGFSTEEANQHINELSGGQKTRIALGKLLLQSPDILLLDEPTNHLDIESIAWLEDFIRAYGKTVVIISHDRYFLDRTVSRVVELENGRGRVFNGNYTDYRQKREKEREVELKAYENEQREIKHQEQVIKKLKEFNREKSIKRAESREKMLEKMTPKAAPLASPENMHFTISPEKESGNDVLSLDNVGMCFTDTPLFAGVSLELERGDRAALIGANGIGKTTLIRIIMNKLRPTLGKVRLGSNVVIGYYDQEQAELNLSKTIYNEISDAYPKLTTTKIRNALAAFVFTGDDVFKTIDTLSGGERGRVALAKIMLSNANFLILDEPTNHLDMQSKQILEDVLNNYTGTVLYISHDRYFINSTAKKILELTPTGINQYLGNYDYYLEKRQNKEEQTVVEESVTEAKVDWKKQKEQQAEDRKRQNALKRLEESIESTEAKIEALNAEMERESAASNVPRVRELYEEIESLEAELEGLYEKYE